jgi:cobalamin biosynthesis Co2+ chelatase CbiK
MELKHLEKHKNYTLKELMDLPPEYEEAKELINNFRARFYLKTLNKPKINNYEDFDSSTKLIYTTIAKKIKELNSEQENLYVIASGSRVNGKWRTDEETEKICKEYNIKKPKYSDYDFITNAKNIPDLTKLAEELKVRYINKIGSYNKNEEVTIPLE